MQQDLEKTSFHNVHCRNLSIAQLLKQHVVSNRKNKIRIFFFFRFDVENKFTCKTVKP